MKSKVVKLIFLGIVILFFVVSLDDYLEYFLFGNFIVILISYEVCFRVKQKVYKFMEKDVRIEFIIKMFKFMNNK